MKYGFLFSLILAVFLFNGSNAQSTEKVKAANFALKSYEGNIIELAQLKGKVVILNFWATWCPPCRAEIPDFIKVYDTYKSQGLVIIGIALDEDGWLKVKPFVDKNKMNYPVVLGTPEVVQQYGNFQSIPTTFAIDTNGNIVGVQMGLLSKDALEQKVKSLLPAPTQSEIPRIKTSPHQPLSTAQKVSAEIKLSTDKIQSGGNAQIAVELKINEDWHINSHNPTFDYLIGTTFELQPKEGIILTDVQYPKGKLVTLGFADQPLDVYEGTTTLFASIKTSDKLALGTDTIKGRIRVQACNNQLCLAPSKIDLNIPVEIVGKNDLIRSLNEAVFANYKPSELISGKEENYIAALFEKKGSFLTYLAIFIIGLALNLTPCVYPMLSVTVSLFGTQTETNVLRIFFKASIYVLGMATMYSVLGASAALGGGLFGSWLQSPWILGSIAALLFALALSSFGAYKIQAPYWLTSKIGGTSGSGLVAVYLSGLVVGVFAAPCVGPPVIALLTFVAANGNAIFGFWAFFLLALGLGFPYLILGTFSGLLKKIPRSGSWLVWVEHIFGVVLIGAALFYLALAIAPKEAVYVVPLVLVIGGIYLGFVDSSAKSNPVLKNIQWIFGIIVILIGLVYAHGMSDKGLEWDNYSDMDLIEAKENGIPVLLDFYADWCIPCIELDRKTWTDPEVMKATYDIRRLKVDLTYFDSEESEALRKKFGISGVPTIVFIRMDGTEATESRIVGYVPPDEFLAKFKQAFSIES